MHVLRNNVKVVIKLKKWMEDFIFWCDCLFLVFMIQTKHEWHYTVWRDRCALRDIITLVVHWYHHFFITYVSIRVNGSRPSSHGRWFSCSYLLGDTSNSGEYNSIWRQQTQSKTGPHGVHVESFWRSDKSKMKPNCKNLVKRTFSIIEGVPLSLMLETLKCVIS